jgi:hypothetical protein
MLLSEEYHSTIEVLVRRVKLFSVFDCVRYDIIISWSREFHNRIELEVAGMSELAAKWFQNIHWSGLSLQIY